MRHNLLRSAGPCRRPGSAGRLSRRYAVKLLACADPSSKTYRSSSDRTAIRIYCLNGAICGHITRSSHVYITRENSSLAKELSWKCCNFAADFATFSLNDGFPVLIHHVRAVQHRKRVRIPFLPCIIKLQFRFHAFKVLHASVSVAIRNCPIYTLLVFSTSFLKLQAGIFGFRGCSTEASSPHTAAFRTQWAF